MGKFRASGAGVMETFGGFRTFGRKGTVGIFGGVVVMLSCSSRRSMQLPCSSRLVLFGRVELSGRVVLSCSCRAVTWGADGEDSGKDSSRQEIQGGGVTNPGGEQVAGSTVFTLGGEQSDGRGVFVKGNRKDGSHQGKQSGGKNETLHFCREDVESAW